MDPFDVLGIAAGASLAEAQAAYRRLAALFHPDHLQGMREDVRLEGARRLREATEAIQILKTGGGRSWRPPEPAEVTRYNAQVRACRAQAIHAAWGGLHAGAIWAALRRAHATEGAVEQVEWGAYECTLTGWQVQRLLGTALAARAEWRLHPLVSLTPRSIDVEMTLGWLADHLDDGGAYLVTAEVF